MDFEPFFQYLDQQRRCSSFTVRAYRNDLKFFRSFLKSSSVTRLSQIDHLIINGFVEHLRSKANARTGRTGLADASIARRLAAISSLFEYTRATTDFKLRNPIKSVTRKWQKDISPKPIDEMTLDLLLTGMTNLRDQFMFTLFLVTGLRVSELHQLNRNSIQIEEEVSPTSGESVSFRQACVIFPLHS